MDLQPLFLKKDTQFKELGASMMEAVLLVALISIVAIGSTRAVGQKAKDRFNKVNQTLETGAATDCPISGCPTVSAD